MDAVSSTLFMMFFFIESLVGFLFCAAQVWHQDIYKRPRFIPSLVSLTLYSFALLFLQFWALEAFFGSWLSEFGDTYGLVLAFIFPLLPVFELFYPARALRIYSQFDTKELLILLSLCSTSMCLLFVFLNNFVAL